MYLFWMKQLSQYVLNISVFIYDMFKYFIFFVLWQFLRLLLEEIEESFNNKDKEFVLVKGVDSMVVGIEAFIMFQIKKDKQRKYE